ncbi:Glycerol-3-phosphate dehydrogenase, partial [Caligus rogercresseyi]
FLMMVPISYLFTDLALPLKGKIPKDALGISLIKGFQIKNGELFLLSEAISDLLDNLSMSVMMGANLATEIAEGKFCESTIGCKDYEIGRTFRSLFQTEIFRTQIVEGDSITVEIWNGNGNNTKAAIIRMGLMEMIHFVRLFHPDTQISTYLESCGVADTMTTGYGGFAKAYPEKSFEALEAEMLKGQKLQGPLTAKEVAEVIHSRNLENK